MATFLLLHGACHGGWCWDQVAPVLRDEGHAVVAPDLPCEDLGAGPVEYADQAEAALAGAPDEDLVVVGHSLAALVAPVVAVRRPVRRLTFLAGVIGQPGRTLEELAETDADRDGPLAPEELERDDAGRFRFSAACARRALYHDCPDHLTEAAIARLRFQRSFWRVRAPFDAWPTCEMSSIVCTEDLIVNPDWSRRIAKDRLGVTPIELAGGHSPFLSRPTELAALLTDGL